MPSYEITSSGNLVLNKTTDEATKTTTWDLKVDAEHLNNDLRATNPGETVRYSNKDLGVVSTKGVTATIELVDVLNPDKIRVGDTVLCEYRKDGVLHFDYWTVTAVGSSNADLVGIKSTQIQLGSTQPVKEKRIHISSYNVMLPSGRPKSRSYFFNVPKSEITIDDTIEVGDTVLITLIADRKFYFQKWEVSAVNPNNDQSQVELTYIDSHNSPLGIDLTNYAKSVDVNNLTREFTKVKTNLDTVLSLLRSSGALTGDYKRIEGTLLALNN